MALLRSCKLHTNAWLVQCVVHLKGHNHLNIRFELRQPFLLLGSENMYDISQNNHNGLIKKLFEFQFDIRKNRCRCVFEQHLFSGDVILFHDFCLQSILLCFFVCGMWSMRYCFELTYVRNVSVPKLSFFLLPKSLESLG